MQPIPTYLDAMTNQTIIRTDDKLRSGSMTSVAGSP
jgi:hypothetical protein